MAGAPGAAGQASPEQLPPEQPQQGFLSRFLADDQKCQLMLLKTLQTNPYVKLLLDAMKRSGCAVNRERHFSCEDCNGNVSGGFDASVSQDPAQFAVSFLHFFLKVFLSIFSGNSSRVGQWWSFIVDSLLIQNLNQKHFTYILIEFSQFYEIVLCQNNIRNQAHMNRVVTHELIHTFDHCRAHVDWFTNVRHLACSEKIQRVLGTFSIFARALSARKAFVDPYVVVTTAHGSGYYYPHLISVGRFHTSIRAANLSGDCSLVNEIFRLRFGLRQHHQTCVRDRAILSILAVRNVSKEVAEKAVDEVFESCFNDHEPFGRIPHNKTYAKYAHRDFQNRHRYYSNI